MVISKTSNGMLLKSVELSGFKSFAKKSVFEFSSPISAIVGPNGSGKSNVAEAFRFVLGEQSIKSLRGKKGEDLIFNGAGESARANRASVKVTFDNSRKFLNIDFPEVTIERVVHRDGINEYLVNGSQIRLRDVVELLATAHIGSSGHHIISQGEADRILNANMKERRAMIEDALGLKIYQYKRVESERKLEKTNENIESVESLRREISPHLKFLRKQVEKVEKVAEMKTELIALAKEYLKREKIYIDETRKNAEERIAPLERKKKELEKELELAREILQKSGNKDEKREKVIEIERRIQAARARKEKLLGDAGRIAGVIAAEEKILDKEKGAISAGAGGNVAIAEVEILSEEVHRKLGDIEVSKDVGFVKRLVGEIRSLFDSFIKLHKDKIHNVPLEEALRAIAGLKKEKKEIDEKLNMAREEEEKLHGEYGKIQLAIEKEKDTSRDAEKSLFRIMAEENKLDSELIQGKGVLEKLHLLEEDFKRELEECAMLGGREVLAYAGYEFEISGSERSAQEERRRRLEKIKIRLEDTGTSGSEEVLKEYRETSERDAFLERELDDLHKSAESLFDLIGELGEKLDLEFREGVEKINSEFQKFFSIMFGGGTAKLRLVKNQTLRKRRDELEMMAEDAVSGANEEEEETEDGIEIDVSLPRKKIKGLMMLSGGERALTSIALIFAMSQVNPPPFIVLDETDAALDEANSRKYGDMIENLAKHSELILITHNRETMSRAGIIYGVTMGSGGGSKVLSIQFEEAMGVAK